MLQIHFEYFPVLLFTIVSLVLSLVIYGLSYAVATHHQDAEKGSAYECGFEPYGDARGTFDVRFYLVAILFIVFDLEAAYLFPWAVSLGQMSLEGFYAMIDFIIELTIGFYYAWAIGALEWE